MSWKQYVERHLAGRTQAALAALVAVDPGTISRWRKGDQGVNAAVAISFARKVGDSPLRALIAAGHLTPEEAEHTVTLDPDYSQLSNDDLLALVRARMREERSDGAGNTAPMKPAGGSPAPDNVTALTGPDPGADFDQPPVPPLHLAAARDVGEPSAGERIRSEHDERAEAGDQLDDEER